eukprot:scaffold8927_cov176-Amphora_coffeaeformis.AAC.9
MAAPYQQQLPPVVDLLSFDSWENETMAMSASTTTVTSSSSSSVDEGIRVSISGVLFNLDSSTFDKLRKLPWKEEEISSVDDEPVASFSLLTSPEIFDCLIHHVLFGTLPRSMPKHDMEELEVMALSLGLSDLAQHLSVAQPPTRRKLLRQASYPVKRTSALRSWASVKRWSSTGRLVMPQKVMEKKNKAQKKAEPPVQTHLSSATRHLA